MFSFFKKDKSSEKRKTCVAIVPAAGSSSRMQGRGDKLFAEINGIPVIARTLLTLQSCPGIDEIIIATKEEFIIHVCDICKAYSLHKVSNVIKGGATRTESVLNGIIQANGKFDLVAIHDAARPFASPEIIESTIEAASKFNAAAPAVPLKDTIKLAEGGIIKSTIPRETLFAIQTPQIFDSALISGALKKAVDDGANITDDCSAVEKLGMRVVLTDGDYFNIKITTPEDIILAEAIAKQQDRNEVL